MKVKLLSVLFFFGMLLGISAGPMGIYDPDAKSWRVTGSHYSCTFFQGCMYPVWFRNSTREEFPFFMFTDHFTDGKTTYRIEEERWGEFQVVKNTAEEFVMEIRGNFCTGLPPYNTPCREVRAIYRYSMKKNSPDLKIGMEFTRLDSTKEYRLDLMQLRWRFMPFQTFAGRTETLQLKDCFRKPGTRKTAGGSLLSPVMDLSLQADTLKLRWDNSQNGFLYLEDGANPHVWKGDRKSFSYSSVIRWVNHPVPGGRK